MSRRLLLIATAALTLVTAEASSQAQAPSPAPGTTVAPAAAPPATVPAPSSPKAPAPRTAAAVPTTPPARTGSSAANQPEYRIGSGDKLQINVYKEADLTQALQVRPDGRITMPLIGDFAAAGQTPMQLQRTLSESLREYVTNPVVTVMVVEVAPRVVYVMGEVNTPGAVPLQGTMTVLQALAVAGGFKDFANTKNIMIKRTTAAGVQTIKFDYKKAINSDSKPVYLQPGDVIIVP